VVRHPFIHYPDDPQTWNITYQSFMLGRDFYIAPVTDEGADSVTVYLPRGEWVHLWSGQTFTGGQTVTVAAPLGQPGVFYIQGSAWGETLRADLTAQGLMP
jgi:sulfoquinovosidase